jgi:hypothetical protein
MVVSERRHFCSTCYAKGKPAGIRGEVDRRGYLPREKNRDKVLLEDFVIIEGQLLPEKRPIVETTLSHCLCC